MVKSLNDLRYRTGCVGIPDIGQHKVTVSEEHGQQNFAANTLGTSCRFTVDENGEKVPDTPMKREEVVPTYYPFGRDKGFDRFNGDDTTYIAEILPGLYYIVFGYDLTSADGYNDPKFSDELMAWAKKHIAEINQKGGTVICGTHWPIVSPSPAYSVVGKGNKERFVYFGTSCRKAIDAYLEERKQLILTDNRALFGSRNGNRISVTAVHRLVEKALKQAGLDSTQFSAHKLRHTAATMMLSGGVDVKTVQEVLGHENLNTTQIYTHIENTELKIAAEANPLSKLDFSE